MKITILVVGLLISGLVSATEKTPVTPKVVVKQQTFTPSFLFLRGHKQGQGYGLQWSMSSTAGIDRFEVQYTYEDPYDPYSNWYGAGWVNNSNQNIFKYTDMGCIPGIINYRVMAILSNNAGTVVSVIYTCTIGE